MKRLFFVLGSLFALACAGVGIASAQPGGAASAPLLTPTPSPTASSGTVIGTTTPLPTCGPGSEYVVSPQSSATIVAGTTDTGNHCNDCVTLVTLPFPYALYGVTYNGVYVSDNGTLQFASSNRDGDNTCLPNAQMSSTIFALWDDLRTDWLTPDPTGIYTSVSSEGGGLVFNIEWRAVYNLNACCVSAHFEVRLFQGQDRFETIYQHTDQGGGAATIGVQRSTGHSYTQYLCNPFGGLPDGTRLIFRPYACGEPTFTPTGTATATPPTPPPPTSPVRTITPTSTYTPTITATASPCAADYAYATFTASIVPGTADTGNHCDDCNTQIALPFPVRLYGQNYSTALIDSNGLLHFATPNLFDYVCFPLLQFPYTMVPFRDDLVTDCTGCGVFTSVSGSAPSRILNVEWRAAPFGGGTGRDNFEIRIYENSAAQRFDFVYGETVASANATVGVQGDNTHWTQYGCNDHALPSGLCVVFTLPPCGTVTVTPTVGTTNTHTYTPTVTPTHTQTATATVSPACTGTWSIYPHPRQGTLSNDLRKVAVITQDDIWTVGSYDAGGVFKMLAMHWNGIEWSIVPTPDAQGGSQLINDVSAVGHNDVWAVGSEGNSILLAMHWDGAQWSRIATPSVGADYVSLNAVSARAGNDVWAVGSRHSLMSPMQTLTMHWNGTEWSMVPSPSAPPENTVLRGVTAVAANDVWAVGVATNGFLLRALIMHWNGTAWSFYDLGTTQFLDALYDVSAASANDIWAVGVQGLTDIIPSGHTLTMHWNGTNWTRVPSPDPVVNGSTLNDVSALASGQVWAVGYYIPSPSYAFRTLIERWDGMTWSIVSSPNAGADSTTLSGVGSVPGGTAWAVGYNNTVPGVQDGFILRYSGGCITPTATVTPCPMNFTDVHPTDYFYQAVRYLYCMGAISGYADNSFRPYNDTTRGQVTKIVVLAERWAINTEGGPHFSDVPSTNPFYAFVETAYNRGIISGYADGTFRWGANVTRGQLCKVVVLAEGWQLYSGIPHFTDVSVSHPFYTYIETAYAHGIISGYADRTFRPQNNATRGQISKVVYSAVTQP